MKTYVKIFFVLVVVAVIGVIAWVSVINYFYSKPVEYNDSDLLIVQKKFNSSENGFLQLLPNLREVKKIKKFDNLSEEVEVLIDPEKEFDSERANKILNEHSDLLNALANALLVNNFHIPYEENLLLESKTKERYTSELTFVCYLALLKSRLLMCNQSFGKAGDSLEKVMKFSYLLQHSENEFLGYLVGSVIKEKTIELLKQMLEQSAFGTQYYKDHMANINPYLDNRGMDTCLKIEYTILANTIKQFPINFAEKKPELQEKHKRLLEGRGMLGGYFYSESMTLSKMSNYFRQEVKNTSLPYNEIKHVDVARVYKKNGIDWWLMISSSNALGKTFIDLMQPKLGNCVKNAVEFDSKCQLLKAMIAIKAFKVENNKLPDSLDELIPDYLQSLPQDSFTQKPVIYDSSKKIVYSVDENLTDDTGDEEKDLVWKLSF